MNVDDLRARLERFRGFLKQDPQNTTLAGDVAELHLRLGEFKLAREVLESALAHSPSNPGLLSRLANVAMASNDAPHAIRLLTDLIEAGHRDPVIYHNLAYAFLYTRDPQKAKDVLLKIEDPAKTMPRALLLLAQAEHRLGELPDALSHVNAYLEQQPEDPEALGTLAILHLDAENVDAARAAAEKALRLDARDLSALITLGSLALSAQDVNGAFRYFGAAVEKHPRSGRAWSGLGLAQMMSLNIDEAIKSMRNAVQYMTDHIGTWHALAWCLLLKDDLAGAEENFKKSLEINRSFGETHGGLAVLYVLQGRLDEAEQAAKRGLRLDRNSFSARFAESLIVNKTNPQKAQEMIRSILSSSPVPGGDPLHEVVRRAMTARADTPPNTPLH